MNAGDFFADEFIDDFLQEAEEHLQMIFDNLLALENSQQIADGAERASQQDNLITALLRSYHTLKGLSGMIGLDAAAQISHGLEGVLKDVQRVLIPLNKNVIDGLLQGSRALQDWIETLRNAEHPAPAIDDVLQMLRSLQPPEDEGDLLVDMPFLEAEPDPQEITDSTPAAAPQPQIEENAVPLPDFLARSLKPGQETLIQQASARGERLYHFTFSPSKEKAAAGITVNQIRAQLESVGKIILAIPEIAGKNVRFHFLLASPTPLSASDFPEVTLKAIQPKKRTQNPEKPHLQIVHSNDDLMGLRIRLGDLNSAMHLVGSLVVTYARMSEHVRKLPKGAQRKRLQADLDNLSRTLRDLRETILRMRMVPVANLFARVPLLVRQTCQQTGKQVTLNIIGQNTLLDKVLAEKLTDPLLHLVRNAITHGIEFPEERNAAGKTPFGTLTLQAETRGENVFIYISDDGAGLDLEKIRQKGIEKGLLPADTHRISTDEALRLICLPGFSTRESADMGAGRGVGMDVVAQSLQSLGGTLSLETFPGKGTTFILRLPLTLAILDAFLVRSGDYTFAIPKSNVSRILAISPADLTEVRGTLLLRQKEHTYLHLVDINRTWNLPASTRPQRYGLISIHTEKRIGLLCDQVLGLQELVVLPAKDPLLPANGLLGAAELGNGDLILLYELENLIEQGKPK